MKKIIAITLCLMMAFSLAGCGSTSSQDGTGKDRPLSENSIDLSADIKANPVDTESVSLNGDYAVTSTDFAVRLFQTGVRSGENTLISPVSVLYALAMTANGANNETRTQMENVLGAPVSELNTYLHAYMNSLPQSEKYKLSIANAIWFTDHQRFTVNKDFLQTNADYYGAGIYQAPFDNSTLKDINHWVENKTDGMIRNILDKIPEEAVMYLVNALAFDAEWQDIYKDYQISGGIFTKENGETQSVKMMYSEESQYLEDELATGFMKYYADSTYAFAALLPKEGISVEEYVASLSGEKLHAMLSNPEIYMVSATMPQFESDYSTEMSDILRQMGMPDAFDVQKADFTGIGSSTEGNIFINRVLHKTHIAVDEKGTRAGASTVVEMTDKCAIGEMREVVLDRPFVYMLVDCEANLPLFIGTAMEIS